MSENTVKLDLLCRLGFHRWKYKRKTQYSNNRICVKCGLLQEHVQKNLFSDSGYRWITHGHVKEKHIIVFILKWEHERKRDALRDKLWREQYLDPDFKISNYKPRFGFDFEEEIDRRLGRDNE